MPRPRMRISLTSRSFPTAPPPGRISTGSQSLGRAARGRGSGTGRHAGGQWPGLVSSGNLMSDGEQPRRADPHALPRTLPQGKRPCPLPCMTRTGLWGYGLFALRMGIHFNSVALVAPGRWAVEANNHRQDLKSQSFALCYLSLPIAHAGCLACSVPGTAGFLYSFRRRSLGSLLGHVVGWVALGGKHLVSRKQLGLMGWSYAFSFLPRAVRRCRGSCWGWMDGLPSGGSDAGSLGYIRSWVFGHDNCLFTLPRGPITRRTVVRCVWRPCFALEPCILRTSPRPN